MKRTLAGWTACALVATAALSSCATFEEDSNVAVVNGTELSEETLAQMAESDMMSRVFQSPPTGGVIDGGELRSLLRVWALYEIYDQTGLLDEATKEQARAQLATEFGDSWESAPAEIRELAARSGALSALDNQGVLDPTVLQNAERDAVVRIDPKYGYWDAATTSIQPIGVAGPVAGG